MSSGSTPILALALLVSLPFCSEDIEGDQPGECSDGADNDRDGTFDCNDSDCTAAPACKKPDYVSVGHCAAGEATYFSCKVKSGKTLSICGSPELDQPTAWLQYRFGPIGAVELGWPKERAASLRKFRFVGNDEGMCGMRCICEHLYYDSNAYRFDVHTDECLPSFDHDTGEPYLPSEPMAAVSVYKKGTFKSMQECRDPLGSASVHDSLGLLEGHVPPGEPF